MVVDLAECWNVSMIPGPIGPGVRGQVMARDRHVGNLKQFSRGWCGNLGGICSPKPQECAQYVNQSSLKFAAKTQYSQFSVGEQESGQLGNLSNSLGCGIDFRVAYAWNSRWHMQPWASELCLVWQSTTVQMCCQDAVQTVQSGKVGKWACGN
jgi:hypothetical protein